jgi:hypothetical protein
VTENQSPRLSQEQIEDFTHKFSRFANSLSRHERTFLEEILAHASMAGGQAIGQQAGSLAEFMHALNSSYGEETERPVSSATPDFIWPQ